MKYLLPAIMLCLAIISCTRKIYVVRHAEKMASMDTAKMMATDPPLSDAGKVRALVLRDELARDHIRHIYSTNTIRSIATVEPLSERLGISVDRYKDIDSLVTVLKATKGNTVVVGHSNTVDDIVNKLCGQTKIAGDLKDGEYDNLFIVRMRGKKAVLQRQKYGYPSNP